MTSLHVLLSPRPFTFIDAIFCSHIVGTANMPVFTESLHTPSNKVHPPIFGSVIPDRKKSIINYGYQNNEKGNKHKKEQKKTSGDAKSKFERLAADYSIYNATHTHYFKRDTRENNNRNNNVFIYPDYFDVLSPLTFIKYILLSKFDPTRTCIHKYAE